MEQLLKYYPTDSIRSEWTEAGESLCEIVNSYASLHPYSTLFLVTLTKNNHKKLKNRCHLSHHTQTYPIQCTTDNQTILQNQQVAKMIRNCQGSCTQYLPPSKQIKKILSAALGQTPKGEGDSDSLSEKHDSEKPIN